MMASASVLAAAPGRRPPWWPIWLAATRDPGVWVGAGMFTGVVLLAALAPLLAPMDPGAQDIVHRLLPPMSAAAGHRFWLGTDQLGRDLLSRIIFGSRISLLVGLSAVAISALVGTAIGVASGYAGRGWDDLLMRITDVQLAFPSILLSLAIVAMLGAGVRNLIAVLALSGWVGYARVTRSRVLGIRRLEYIDAARTMGARDGRIVVRHVVPNVVPSVVTIASFSLGGMITSEAALTFLGLGIPSNIPSWGGMLTDGAQYLSVAWWLATFPGAAIMLTVLATNLIGDWLRDVLDPRAESGAAR
ncbi:MAG TPA: ABC transporter permease [bacterium]|nr:ABC transporter permease [bacterium]